MLTKNIAAMKTETAAHIEADAVVQGEYWIEGDNQVGGNGCFIGCLTHSDDASVLALRFGMPAPLVRVCEDVFEALPKADATDFFADIPEAIDVDGKDLSLVIWQFLAAELRAIPTQPDDIQACIDPVIAGLDLLAAGDEWPDADAARAASVAVDAARAATRAANATYYAAGAARAAAGAARAAAGAARAAAGAASAAADADAAYYAARAASVASDAAYATYAAAARAVDAARAAARLRQRDTILQMLRDAPIGVEQ